MENKKTEALVVTFNTTVGAMEAESSLQDCGISGRLGPIPPGVESEAGCGLAWIAPPDAEDQVRSSLKEAGIDWADMQIREVPEEELTKGPGNVDD